MAAITKTIQYKIRDRLTEELKASKLNKRFSHSTLECIQVEMEGYLEVGAGGIPLPF
jgi:hypothetical protein